MRIPVRTWLDDILKQSSGGLPLPLPVGTISPNAISGEGGEVGQAIGVLSDGSVGFVDAVSSFEEISGTVTIEQGGLGITSYNMGDMLYANSLKVLTKLPIGAVNSLLQVNDAGTLPEWTRDINVDSVTVGGQLILNGSFVGTSPDYAAKLYPLRTASANAQQLSALYFVGQFDDAGFTAITALSTVYGSIYGTGGTHTFGNVWDMYFQSSGSGTVTVNNYTAINIGNPVNLTVNGIATAIYVESITSGSVANYSIYTNAGIARFGGVIYAPNGAVGAPAYSFENNPDTGMFLTNTPDALQWALNGTNLIVLSAASFSVNVGSGAAGFIAKHLNLVSPDDATFRVQATDNTKVGAIEVGDGANERFRLTHTANTDEMIVQLGNGAGGYTETARFGKSIGLNLSDIATAVTTNYGILVGNVTGATTNYAIYTGSGWVRIGDNAAIGTSVVLGARLSVRYITDLGASSRTGLSVSCEGDGTGAAGERRGIYVAVQSDPDVATTQSGVVYGVKCTLNLGGAGTTTSARGVFVETALGGTVTNLYGVYVNSPVGSGVVVNQYGIYVADINDGTTLKYAIYTNAGDVRFGGLVNTTEHYEVDGVQVVGNQGAAVADATGGGVVDTECRAAVNTLLARVRTHGLITT